MAGFFTTLTGARLLDVFDVPDADRDNGSATRRGTTFPALWVEAVAPRIFGAHLPVTAPTRASGGFQIST
jgi:hypothetical protein